ncbi:MAG: AmmeMemoRadiSam system protein B [Candidatus Abyssobacteria bacterium SURF_17]|jgi:AmmeMemoRadiSam system protein B|uniref:AmmeMemoRadiSam system protein B n=1 Tax=Candidatus Abyssobacteria bacterium SURF_17 TaxID=2093361 RepID=A0A419F314_9BACT|nr:MAG: AmmeMemoRadiSam system protein B [Candidatus Abyssubacteria bacterium SURF_17]
MRRKQFAANFYAEASTAWIEKALQEFKAPKLEAPPVAGIVPHAGWAYSGAVAAKVFQTIKCYREPKTFVLFGTVHRDIADNAIYPRGSWLTPFGEVSIDEGLAADIVEGAGEYLIADESAHHYEHSIEVQMPFLKHFFPRAEAVPIAVLPDERAHELGKSIGELLKKTTSDAVVLGTTDLTHYGDAYWFTPSGRGPAAREWMKRNDARIIELASTLRAQEIVAEAIRNQNACGAGALAATAAAAKAMGCSGGRVIEYTTSYDVMPEGEFRMAVGYVGMVFCGS